MTLHRSVRRCFPVPPRTHATGPPADTWRSAAGDRRNHRDLGSRRYLGFEPLREPDVLFVDVDVDKTPQLPALVETPPGETRRRRGQVREDLTDGSLVR